MQIPMILSLGDMELSAVIKCSSATQESDSSQHYSWPSHQSLPDLKCTQDDWTGVTNTATRKKLQNRLNQRAWRRRQKANSHQAIKQNTSLTSLPQTCASVAVVSSEEGKQQAYSIPTDLSQDEGGLSLVTKADHLRYLRDFLKQAYEEYTLHVLRPSSLPLLVRINLLNALAFNASLLPMSSRGLCCVDLISSFNLFGPLLPSYSAINYPSDLRPSLLQKSMVHHPWIDLLPFAALRDNILRFMALGYMDDGDLCDDILGLHEGALSEGPAMIVWGEPSLSTSWEVNTAFLRKWGWIVRGCPQIITATNVWRIRRGENPISFNA
ncbi:hypothetical protein FSST1_006498 [Fusarium sambucinum]